MAQKLRTQRRIKGIRRAALYSSYLPELEKAVKAEARRFRCSVSLVIVTAVSDALGVDIGEEPLSPTQARRALRVLAGGRR